MKNDNLARLPFNGPKDGDGEDSEAMPVQIIIDSAENGYTVSVHGQEEFIRVFLFNGQGEDGPRGMIQTIIENLGLRDKVKLDK